MSWGLFWTIALAITIGPILVELGVLILPIVLIGGLLLFSLLFILGTEAGRSYLFLGVILFLLGLIRSRIEKHPNFIKIISLVAVSLIFYVFPLYIIGLGLLTNPYWFDESLIFGLVLLLPIGATTYFLYERRSKN